MLAKLVYAAGATWAMAGLPLAQAQHTVAEVYLLGPMPTQVAIPERLPHQRSEVTVVTGRNSAGRPLTHKVTTSGGIGASELPGILRTLLINHQRWNLSKERWQIRVHGDNQLVKVVFLFPTLPRHCDMQWLVTHTRSGWMRLDPGYPRRPNCVSLPQTHIHGTSGTG